MKPVRGIELDAQTRCAHYHTPLDIVAIRMMCCLAYYACVHCHEALADHPLAAWPYARRHEPAVLCGACGFEMTANAYLHCGDRCPHCRAAFNPGCTLHHHYYFEPEAEPHDS